MRIKHQKKIGMIIIVLVVFATAIGLWAARTEDRAGYRFVTIERGDIESVITATGTLEAVTTVSVGTQISGIVAELYADFNAQVKAGQLIARLDTMLLENAVEDARTSLIRAQADERLATADMERATALRDQGVLAPADFDMKRRALETARANVTSAHTALTRARQNLGYAEIRAPISGIVIGRSVDAGQTVAASLTAPELFRIAADLAHMQIVASVDESDIGRIAPEQPVRFNVEAYPDETFSGETRQVRMQAAIQENVVSYPVVIDVDNVDGRLLPGMTASVEFVVNTAHDVLKVSNAALRFRPTDAALAKLSASNAARSRSRNDGKAVDPARVESAQKRSGSSTRAVLWSLDDKGALMRLPVRVGITDGQTTMIEDSRVAAGQRVIVGITQGEAATASANPFQQPRGNTRGPRRGGF
ncbi:MAG: efflux RND transporter periplasmic adaptor subunit [Vicinamibacteria bacterium]|nr:efflux RND transporter periplasmic adaptor subunit [Vicinamibacteria bacterium]